jgi:hypothetical protein
MAITGTLQNQIQLTHTGTADLSTPTEDVINSANWFNWVVTNGTGLDQMDTVWHDQRTLTATTSEDIDLAGSLVDTYGNTLTFASIKLIYIFSAVANGGLIQVGGAGSNTFVNWVANATDILQVRNGGAMMLTAPDATGYAVTAGTADILKINNTDASSATYNIVIGGVSA